MTLGPFLGVRDQQKVTKSGKTSVNLRGKETAFWGLLWLNSPPDGSQVLPAGRLFFLTESFEFEDSVTFLPILLLPRLPIAPQVSTDSRIRIDHAR